MKTCILKNAAWKALPVWRTCINALATLIACVHLALAGDPIALSSPKDISRAPRNLTRAFIGFLPLNDYALLSKFKEIREFDFFTENGTGATDDKLAALARLKFD